MKVRYGFVSNSSSSSFTCLVCGNTESGMDACARDFGFLECDNGHLFCNTHMIRNKVKDDLEHKIQKIRNCKEEYYITRLEEALKIEDKNDKIEEIDSIIDDMGLDLVDSLLCHICQFLNPLEPQFSFWLLKKLGWNQKEALKKIKEEYNGDIKDFCKANK